MCYWKFSKTRKCLNQDSLWKKYCLESETSKDKSFLSSMAECFGCHFVVTLRKSLESPTYSITKWKTLELKICKNLRVDLL